MTEPSIVALFPYPAVRMMLERVAQLPCTSPFDPGWLMLEHALVPAGGLREDRIPGDELVGVSYRLLGDLSSAAALLRDGGVASPDDLAVYRGAAIYALWGVYRDRIQKIIDDDGVEVPFWDAFVATYNSLQLGRADLGVQPPEILLPMMYQWRRNAFYITTSLRGSSRSMTAARVAVYRANMGPDVRTYVAGLYRSLDAIPVLITGETGTGKELVARCVGWGRFIPFDEGGKRLVTKHKASMHVQNLGAVPHDLLPSTLFGHKKGSFTGAIADTTGLFGQPEACGSLFLDEIGEIPTTVQVMLLRPLENREFVPVGDTRVRPALGRHLFATNQDLAALVLAGKFRKDLLERMNGVRIHLPSLRKILAESPGELRRYVRWFLADDAIAAPEEVDTLTDRIVAYVSTELRGHGWTSNLRELKHFTQRFVLSGGTMPRPEVVPAPPEPEVEALPSAAQAAQAEEEEAAPEATRVPDTMCHPSSGLFGPKAKEGEVPANAILGAYVTEVYVGADMNLTKTAQLTGLDRRTARKLIDRARLARLLARRKKK